MKLETDSKDKRESRRLAVLLLVIVGVFVVAALLMLPLLSAFVSTHLAPGLGLKDAAVVAFFVAVTLMVVFAVAAGDGLLGELQFILGGFFAFFLIFWLMIAWIF